MSQEQAAAGEDRERLDALTGRIEGVKRAIADAKNRNILRNAQIAPGSLPPGIQQNMLLGNFVPGFDWAAHNPELVKAAAEIVWGLIPYLGQALAVGEAALGSNVFGDELETDERALRLVLAALPLVGALAGSMREAPAMADAAAAVGVSQSELNSLVVSLDKAGRQGALLEESFNAAREGKVLTSAQTIAVKEFRQSLNEIKLLFGVSRNEYLEQFTDQRYFPHGEPVAFKQPAVDRTLGTLSQRFSEEIDQQTGVLKIQETRGARSWVQYKILDENPPDRLITNVRANVQTAMEKFDKALGQGGSVSLWKYNTDGSKYRLVLENPTEGLLIHIEVPGFQDLPGDLQETLRKTATEAAESLSENGFGQPISLEGLPVQVEVVQQAPITSSP